ncbi:hypothetical protein GCM10023197_03210 [Gordonia humi]
MTDRRRRLAAIGIAVVCVLAVIVGAYAVYRAATSTQEEPRTDTEQIEDRVRAYGDVMTHFDAQAFGDLVCAGLGPVVGAPDGAPEPSQIAAGRDARTVIDAVKITGDTAAVDARIDLGATSVPIPMTLRRESDGWCISELGSDS